VLNFFKRITHRRKYSWKEKYECKTEGSHEILKKENNFEMVRGDGVPVYLQLE
jgi:hypothetical protein